MSCYAHSSSDLIWPELSPFQVQELELVSIRLAPAHCSRIGGMLDRFTIRGHLLFSVRATFASELTKSMKAFEKKSASPSSTFGMQQHHSIRMAVYALCAV
jgi:hypothetical protein